MRRRRLPIVRSALLGLLLTTHSLAQAEPGGGWGRFSLFGQMFSSTRGDRTRASFTELTASLALRSPSADEGGFEYALDARGATYPSAERDNRVSIFDAYVGGRTSGGRLSLHVGQMYLSDLGSLGALGGVLVETRFGRFRLGVFGGLEPKSFEAGWVQDVRKGGAYVVLEGERARRHVVAYVTLRDAGIVERNVVVLTNFVPLGQKVFIYQAAEYDITGPGGNGAGGLSYLFVNARANLFPRVEVTGIVQHGRSIDTRTIAQDLLNGHPVDPASLQGLLYDSAGARLSVEVIRGLRLQAGYARDRNNRDDAPSHRTTLGLSASNLAGTGVDVTVTDNRIDRSAGGYDSWYASLGRSLGPRIYLSIDASTSLSVLRVVDTGGVVIESRPRGRRLGLSAVANLGRSISLLLTGERLTDDSSTDLRGLLGLTYRF